MARQAPPRLSQGMIRAGRCTHRPTAAQPPPSPSGSKQVRNRARKPEEPLCRERPTWHARCWPNQTTCLLPSPPPQRSAAGPALEDHHRNTPKVGEYQTGFFSSAQRRHFVSASSKLQQPVDGNEVVGGKVLRPPRCARIGPQIVRLGRSASVVRCSAECPLPPFAFVQAARELGGIGVRRHAAIAAEHRDVLPKFLGRNLGSPVVCT